jgi:hypothetical protein
MDPANFSFVDGLQTGADVLVTMTRAVAVSVVLSGFAPKTTGWVIRQYIEAGHS